MYIKRNQFSSDLKEKACEWEEGGSAIGLPGPPHLSKIKCSVMLCTN